MRAALMGTWTLLGLLLTGWAALTRAQSSWFLFPGSPSGVTPAPVGCRMGPWRDWTPCCQGTMHRYRKLEQPSKYGGDVCLGNLWETIACPSTQKCVPPPNCGQDFQCKESGRCIKKELVGNGDKDCGDGSDEEEKEDAAQEEPKSSCQELQPIPGAQNAILGFNILTQTEAHPVLDHKYFGGQCETVYNGEWREQRYDPICERFYYGEDEKYFRKPYNFHTYSFLMRADTSMSFEVYESSQEVLRAVGDQRSFGISYAPSIRPSGSPVGVGYEVGVTHNREALKNISTYTSKNLQFIRLNTKIQTARFRMRRSSLMLAEDMLIALRELPEAYDYGPYSRFIADYGTHYVTSGTVGGVLDHILVLDKEEMKRQEITYELTETCFKGSVGLTANVGVVEGKLHVGGRECKKLEVDEGGEPDINRKIIKDVFTISKGGDPPSTGALTNIFDGVSFRMWGSSLRFNPAVIDAEVLPIFELLKQTDLPGLERKRENLKTAYYEFLAEFNPCRCGPCDNNGIPFLDNNACVCRCPQGFDGPACEKTARTGTPVHGSWSCWSSWSQCQSGSRQRSRSCSNPAPRNGGGRCLGKSTHTEFC